MVRKKSGDARAESSIVVPFLKGAKSIEDKVAFLKSIQGNASLSDYDRNLVGRVLGRYTSADSPKYPVDKEVYEYLAKRHPEQVGEGFSVRGDGVFYTGDDVYGNTFRGALPTFVSDKFKKLPMHQIRGLKGKVYEYEPGCRDSGISGAHVINDLSLHDKVSLLIKSNRIADAMELLGTLATHAYENDEDNIRSYNLNPSKSPRNKIANHYFSRIYGRISDLVKGEETRRKQEIRGRLDSGYYNQSRGLKKYFLQDSSRNFGRTPSLRNYLAQDQEIQSRDVGKKVGVTMAVAGFGASIFFIGSNLTGNVIGSLSVDTTNFFGVGAFLIGIVGAMLCFKKK